MENEFCVLTIDEKIKAFAKNCGLNVIDFLSNDKSTAEQRCKDRVWELLNTDGVQVRLESHSDHYLIVHNIYGCDVKKERIFLK